MHENISINGQKVKYTKIALTNSIETRANNKRTEVSFEQHTSRWKQILRNISGYTLRQNTRNTDKRNEWKVEDIIRWGRKRRRESKDHVDNIARERH